MRLNVSAMRNTLRCGQLGYNLHILRRGPIHTPTSLDVGTLFHKGMEQRLAGGEVVPHELPSWTEVSQEARDTFMKHKLWVPINAFAPDPNWEIHGIELKVERQITPNLALEGTLDGFVVWQNKLWDLQWKTYSTSLLDLLDKVRLSWHEVGYQWMAEGTNVGMPEPPPWGGTILGACQKLPGYRLAEGDDGKKHRQEVTDEQRAMAFTMHFLTRPPRVQSEMVAQLLQTAMKVQEELERQVPVSRNYDSCFSPWGGRCPFYTVCHEGANLHGPGFKEVENRYAPKEALTAGSKT